MSLCGHPYQMARCHSNISLSSGKEVSKGFFACLHSGISVIRTPLCYEQFLVPKLLNFIQSLPLLAIPATGIGNENAPLPW